MKKHTKPYEPSQKILDNFAEVLVNFALGDGKGIKKGDTVKLLAFESARPLFIACYKKIIDAGGNVIMDYRPSACDQHDLEQYFYEHASKKQLQHFPAEYFKGKIDAVDHSLAIIGDTNPLGLQNIDSKKISLRSEVFKPVIEWHFEKENQGKYTWCGTQYGTKAMADQAGLTLKEYWAQIIKACFLDKDDPIKEWKNVFKQLHATVTKLNRIADKTDKLHVKGKDVDLWLTLGDKRKWVAGRGRNIPSFEVFTSPDWRGTNGWIRFNQPLYRQGTLIKDVELTFKDGRVVKAKASQGEKALKDMIKTPNADKIGEYSLTDKRLSRITKFMASTLYDENVGGKYGNTHIALGRSYDIAFAGEAAALSPDDWHELGFNKSSVHTDIVSTTDRVVTAHFHNGNEQVIYKNGQFEV